VVRWDVSGPVSSNGYNKNREGPMPEEFLAKRSHGICKFARFIPSYTTEAIRMYYALPYGRMLQPIRLSVCPVFSLKTEHLGRRLLYNTIGNAILEIKPSGQRDRTVTGSVSEAVITFRRHKGDTSFMTK